MQNVNYMRYVLVSTLVLAGLFAAHDASAATLELAPTSPSVSVGDTFTLVMYVNSDQAVNAVTASLAFPTDMLSVVSISKSSSAFTLWVQEPSFSNSAGSVDLSGIVPDPGTSGRSRVLSIQLRAKKAGAAIVRFASAATLANDGQGTNILTATVPASVSIAAASQQTPTTPTKPSVDEAEQTEVDASPTAGPALEAPVITRYSRAPRELEPVVIMGTTKYKSAAVTVHIANGGIETTGTVTTDAQGNFTFVQQEGLTNGDYLAYADVVQEGSRSSTSNMVRLQVGKDANATIIGISVPIVWLSVFIVGLILLLLLIGVYATWRIRHLKHAMDRNLHDVAASLHYATQRGKHRARSAHVKGVLEEMKDRIESTISELHEDLQ